MFSSWLAKVPGFITKAHCQVCYKILSDIVPQGNMSITQDQPSFQSSAVVDMEDAVTYATSLLSLFISEYNLSFREAYFFPLLSYHNMCEWRITQETDIVPYVNHIQYWLYTSFDKDERS